MLWGMKRRGGLRAGSLWRRTVSIPLEETSSFRMFPCIPCQRHKDWDLGEAQGLNGAVLAAVRGSVQSSFQMPIESWQADVHTLWLTFSVPG